MPWLVLFFFSWNCVNFSSPLFDCILLLLWLGYWSWKILKTIAPALGISFEGFSYIKTIASLFCRKCFVKWSIELAELASLPTTINRASIQYCTRKIKMLTANVDSYWSAQVVTSFVYRNLFSSRVLTKKPSRKLSTTQLFMTLIKLCINVLKDITIGDVFESS